MINERMLELAGLQINEAKRLDVKEIVYNYILQGLNLSTYNYDESEDTFSEVGYTPDDVEKSTWNDITKRVKKFVKDAGDMISDYDEETIGFNLYVESIGAANAWEEDRGRYYKPNEYASDLADLTEKHFKYMDSFSTDGEKIYQ